MAPKPQSFVQFLSVGCLKALQKLRISSHADDSLFGTIKVPQRHLQRIEMTGNCNDIGEILEPVSLAVENKLLPVLDTIVIIVSAIPNTLEDMDTHWTKLEKADPDLMVYTILDSLHQEVYKMYLLDPSKTTELVDSIEPPIRQRLSSTFPELNDGSLDVVSDFIAGTLGHCVLSEFDSENGSEAGTTAELQSDSESNPGPDTKVYSEIDIETSSKTHADSKTDTGMVMDNELRSEFDTKTGSKIDTEIGSKIDTEMGSTIDNEMGSTIDTEMGSKIDSEMGSKIDTEMGSTIETEMGSQIDTEMGATIDTEMGSKIDTEMGSKIDTEIGSMIDTEIGSTIDTEMGSTIGNEKGSESGEEMGLKSDIIVDSNTKSRESSEATPKSTMVNEPIEVILQLDHTKFKSVLEPIMGAFKEAISYQALVDMKQNPSLTTQLVASLDPPVADRISSVFTDVDPEVLETATEQITRLLIQLIPDLVPILPDVDKGSEIVETLVAKLIVPFQSLLSHKFSVVWGFKLTDQLESWFHSLITDSYVDPKSERELRASSFSSDVKYRLRKQGIRLYFLHQPESGFEFDDLHIPEVSSGDTKNGSEEDQKLDDVPRLRKIKKNDPVNDP